LGTLSSYLGKYVVTTGAISSVSEIWRLMQQACANIHNVLAEYGATIDNVVDEVLVVTDMNTAFAAAVKCRQEVFSGTSVVASTIVQIQRLAFLSS
jgi:2-iminobutanoate/2-iminopropanoate deaminase